VSYILDSLKKSERQRRGPAPSAPGLPSVPDRRAPQRRWLPWLVAIVIGLNALVLLSVFWPREKPRDVVPSQGESMPLSRHKEASGPHLPTATAAKGSAPDNPADSTDTATSGADGVAGAVVPDPDRVYLLQDMPPEVSGHVKGLKITLHYYSNRAGRSMVRINGRNLREGDLLQPGVQIAEIGGDGVTLDLFGYRVWVEKP